MNIAVCVKRIPKTAEADIFIEKDGTDIKKDHLVFHLNDWDGYAVREAALIKEKHGGEVTVITIGPEESKEVLTRCLAMGADRAIMVVAEQELDSLAAARIFQKVVADEKADLVLMGKQAIDDDANQTGQMLAALLGWPQATFASKAESLESEAEKQGIPGIVLQDGKGAKVVREVDGGLETVEVPLPAVVTVDLRLNTPRYASLPGIMKARKKELKEVPVDSLGIDVTPRLKVIKLDPPPKRQAGRKVGSVQELVQVLHNEAKVI